MELGAILIGPGNLLGTVPFHYIHLKYYYILCSFVTTLYSSSSAPLACLNRGGVYLKQIRLMRLTKTKKSGRNKAYWYVQFTSKPQEKNGNWSA